MRPSKYTKELLAPLVAASSSLVEVLRHLGLQPTGGNYRMLNLRIRALDLDTSHFTGAAWSRGKTSATSESIRRATALNTLPDEAVFVPNCQHYVPGPRLTRRLLRLGWRYECERCGISEWHGDPLTLHLDHINGLHNDNRFENLRFLCPNCHQQTETWGYQGYRRDRKKRQPFVDSPEA